MLLHGIHTLYIQQDLQLQTTCKRTRSPHPMSSPQRLSDINYPDSWWFAQPQNFCTDLTLSHGNSPRGLKLNLGLDVTAVHWYYWFNWANAHLWWHVATEWAVVVVVGLCYGQSQDADKRTQGLFIKGAECTEKLWWDRRAHCYAIHPPPSLLAAA